MLVLFDFEGNSAELMQWQQPVYCRAPVGLPGERLLIDAAVSSARQLLVSQALGLHGWLYENSAWGP